MVAMTDDLDLNGWLDQLDALWEGVADPVRRAELGGAAAPSVAFAFVAGFRAALAVLLPDAGRAALCLSEERGAHPRYLKTALRDGRLTGRKSWTTLGPLAQWFYVAAVRGVDADGRNDLVLVRVPADASGVTVTPMPPTPFLPEIPHCHVTFDVDVDDVDVLPGAAWTTYVRPFRTWEDTYVALALGAFLVRRIAQDREWTQSVEAVMQVLRLGPAFAADDPRWHVLLDGALGRLRQLCDPTHARFDAWAPAERALWARDIPLLDIAGKARALRADRARERLTNSPRPG